MATSDFDAQSRPDGPIGLSLGVDNPDHPKLVIFLRGRFEILRILPYRPLADLEQLLLRAVAPHEVSIAQALISALTTELASRTTGWTA